MGKWNIKDLDKEKTEQSIANEQARLDQCRETVERLKKEFRRMKLINTKNETEILNKIEDIERSIEEGENFVLKCNEHLILDFDLK